MLKGRMTPDQKHKTPEQKKKEGIFLSAKLLERRENAPKSKEKRTFLSARPLQKKGKRKKT